MSRSRSAPTRQIPLATAILVGHLSCMTTLGGCFYVKPFPEPYVNQPPEIIFPEVSPHLVAVRGPTVTLEIFTQDPEDDPIEVEWPSLANVDLNEDVLFPSGGLWIARVEIAEPDAVPGGQVQGLVLDDAGNIVRVDFELVFP